MLEKIARNIVEYSLELKSGENLNIIIRGKSQDVLGREIEKVAKSKGINTRYCYDNFDDFENLSDEEFEAFVQEELLAMQKCDACALVTDMVPRRLSDMATQRRNRYFQIVHKDVRLKKRWNLTSVPCRENCKSEQEYQELYETYIRASSMDYDKMSLAMDDLVKRLEKADKIRIIAKGTDITFSVKGLPPVKCIGKRNLPDGEVYTAPAKNSVNGYITYNLPIVHSGVVHNNVHFEFKDGKIIKETSDHTEELTKVLNTDEGARYIGEFSFGVNPFVKRCFNNALYDEKISGTIHFTPGSAYERCDNGNKSVIHWDIVQSHTPEYGGGEIWIDGQLIRKNGIFVVEDLKCLNPSNLISLANKKGSETGRNKTSDTNSQSSVADEECTELSE